MTSRLAFSLLFLGLFITLAPRVARADDPLTQAKAHFEAGRSAYLAGDYAKAIGEFQAAQAIKPSPILDYNIGLAFEGLGDGPHAIESYRRYLVSKPNADNRADVEQRIQALQSQQPPPQQQGNPNQQAVAVQGTPPGDPNAPQGYQGYAGYQGQPGSPDPYTGTYAPPPVSSQPPPPPRKKSRWWIPVVVVSSVVVTVGLIAAVAVAASRADPVVYAAPPQALEGIPAQTPALLRF